MGYCKILRDIVGYVEICNNIPQYPAISHRIPTYCSSSIISDVFFLSKKIIWGRQMLKMTIFIQSRTKCTFSSDSAFDRRTEMRASATLLSILLSWILGLQVSGSRDFGSRAFRIPNSGLPRFAMPGFHYPPTQGSKSRSPRTRGCQDRGLRGSPDSWGSGNLGPR